MRGIRPWKLEKCLLSAHKNQREKGKKVTRRGTANAMRRRSAVLRKALAWHLANAVGHREGKQRMCANEWSEQTNNTRRRSVIDLYQRITAVVASNRLKVDDEMIWAKDHEEFPCQPVRQVLVKLCKNEQNCMLVLNFGKKCTEIV